MKTLTNAQKLEQRRLRAVALIRQGISQVEVARQLGVWPETVNRWVPAIPSERWLRFKHIQNDLRKLFIFRYTPRSQHK